MRTKKLLLAAVLTFNFLHSTFNSSAQVPNQSGAGNALGFLVNGNRVDVGTNASLRPTGFLTISAWIYANDLSISNAVRGIITNEWPDATPSGYSLSMGTGGVISFFTGDGTTVSNTISATITSGIWYHITATFDGAGKKLYVNGNLVSSAAWASSISYSDNPFFRIGMEYNPTSNPDRRWNGYIDEVCIWNTARTQNEIRDNMCQKLIGNEAGLVGYWRFDETAGNTYFDSSSNGNNGTGF